jgi:hypothetical protein
MRQAALHHDTCSTQSFAPSGATFAERRTDEAARHLTPPDVDDVIGCLTAAMFGEVMKSLRSALSLN